MDARNLHFRPPRQGQYERMNTILSGNYIAFSSRNGGLGGDLPYWPSSGGQSGYLNKVGPAGLGAAGVWPYALP